MSIQQDWSKVLLARQKLEAATTLPERFHASCGYSDECRAFCEAHKYVIGLMVGTSKLPKDKAA